MAKKTLVILIYLYFLSLCYASSSIFYESTVRLEKGVSFEEVHLIIRAFPEHTFILDKTGSEKNVKVEVYSLVAGLYASVYFISYKNDRLFFWGYPHEFARETNELINKIGRQGVDKLVETGDLWKYEHKLK